MDPPRQRRRAGERRNPANGDPVSRERQPTERRIPVAAPTRKTLVFPALDQLGPPFSVVHAAEQPSPLTRLPSSHCSAPFFTPSPQRAPSVHSSVQAS